LWQVASSLTSPTLDAAPDVDVPLFALRGASPSLHAQHEEQRFLFLLESFEWLHWWHGHNKARRVADRSSGILLKEGKREIGQVLAGSAHKYTHFAWAGGTFFPVVLYVVSVFGSGGKKVLVQIHMYYLEYNTVVVVC
jgi:hypothetical protein